MFNITSVCSDVCKPKSVKPCCEPENKLAAVNVISKSGPVEPNRPALNCKTSPTA